MTDAFLWYGPPLKDYIDYVQAAAEELMYQYVRHFLSTQLADIQDVHIGDKNVFQARNIFAFRVRSVAKDLMDPKHIIWNYKRRKP